MRDMTAPLSRQNLLEAVILFGHQLREVGFKVTPAHLEDALRGLLYIQIGERDQFRSALRANLVSSVEDFAKNCWALLAKSGEGFDGAISAIAWGGAGSCLSAMKTAIFSTLFGHELRCIAPGRGGR